MQYDARPRCVGTAISDLLHQEGLGRRSRIKRLKEIVYGPDMSVALRGIDVANRMDGVYIEKHINLNLSYADMSKEMSDLDREIDQLDHELGMDSQLQADG